MPWTLGHGIENQVMQEPPESKECNLGTPGNSQNNPGTHWNLAVQRRNCPAENSTILEGCEISRGIFRPLCEINPVRSFLVRKIPSAKIAPPSLYCVPRTNHVFYAQEANQISEELDKGVNFAPRIVQDALTGEVCDCVVLACLGATK